MGKKRSKYAGKGLNAALAEAFFDDISRKPDAAIFYEDRSTTKDLTSRSAARAQRQREEDQAKWEEANQHKLVSKAELEAVKKLSKLSDKIGKTDTVAVGNAFGVYDAWDDSNLSVEDDWTKASTKKISERRKRDVRARKPTEHSVLAVKVAHPGASYNPSVEANKDALKIAVSAELQFKKRNKRISSIPLMESANKNAPMPAEDESSDDELDSESDDNSVTNIESKSTLIPGKRQPIEGEKLTRAQRNKQKRKRAAEAARQLKLRKKRFRQNIENAGAYVKEIDENESNWNQRRIARKQRFSEKLNTEPLPVMSSGKVMKQVPLVDAVLPSDLSDSMRTLKPHGGLILERFRSMHSRNLIEVPDPDAYRRSKRTRDTKSVMTGKKFIEEEFDMKKGKKKRRDRLIRSGKIDISVDA